MDKYIYNSFALHFVNLWLCCGFRCPVIACTNTKPLHMADMVYDYDLWKQIQVTLDTAAAAAVK